MRVTPTPFQKQIEALHKKARLLPDFDKTLKRFVSCGNPALEPAQRRTDLLYTILSLPFLQLRPPRRFHQRNKPYLRRVAKCLRKDAFEIQKIQEKVLAAGGFGLGQTPEEALNFRRLPTNLNLYADRLDDLAKEPRPMDQYDERSLTLGWIFEQFKGSMSMQEFCDGLSCLLQAAWWAAGKPEEAKDPNSSAALRNYFARRNVKKEKT